MAQRIINNGDSGFIIRKNLNDNFEEIYNRIQQLEGEVPDGNLPPTDITLSASSINEGNEIGDVIGTMLATDPDDGDTHTFELVTGTGDTDNLSFTIEGDQLKANEIFSYDVKSAYSIRIRATDQGGLFFEKQFEITIIEVPVLEFHPEILAYEDGLTTPLDEGQKIRLNNLTDELKTGLGLTSLDEAFDYFYVFGNDTEEVSVRNLVKRAHDCTPYNVDNKLTWEEYKGYRDTGNKGYLMTNYNPAIDGVNFTKDSGSFGLRTFTMNTNGGVEMGCSDGTNRISIRLRSSGTPIYFNNNTSDGTIEGSQSGMPVAHIVSRNSANEFKYYREGVLEYTSTEPSVGVPNAEMQIIGYNNNGTPDTFVQRQQFINFMGRAFTDAEALVITNAINNYIGSLPMFIPTPPEDIFLSSTSVIEGNAVGDVVAEIASTDINPDDTHTYSLVSGTGDTDNASFTIDGNLLKAAEVFDKDVKSTYYIRIRTTDNTNLSFEKEFTITVVEDTITLTNLMTNGSFESWSTDRPTGIQSTGGNPGTDYTFEQSPDSVVGTYSLKVNVTTDGGELISIRLNNFTQSAGNLLYVGMWCKTSKALSSIRVKDISNDYPEAIVPPYELNNWEWKSYIGVSPVNSTSFFLRPIMPGKLIGDSVQFDGFYIIDLTETFGAGNEPSYYEMDLLLNSIPYFETTHVVTDFTNTLNTLKANDAVQAARQVRLVDNIIRVGTLNAKSDYIYPNMHHRLVSDMDLDLLSLDECALTDDTSISLENRTKNNNLVHFYQWGRTATAYGMNGLGMASAFTMLNTIDSPTPSQGYIKTTIQLAGQDVSFYGLHLPAFGTDVQGKAYITGFYNDVIASDTNDYIIVSGDFNYPWTQDYSIYETFTNNGFESAQGPTHGWKVTFQPDGYIDNVLVKGFNILSTEVRKSFDVSDHDAFIAEIQMILP